MVQKNKLTEKIRIILASASPRRNELLRQIGIEPEIIPSQVEECVTLVKPEEVVMELSAQKAEEVAGRVSDQNAVVIGSDTVVSIDGTILGKPADRAEAEAMLRHLQGRSHQVYTGVTLICGGKKRTFASETEVEVYPMTEEEIADYIDSGDCMDKAGAYGIQGRFAAHIKGVRGSYTNVVGLPVGRVYQELKALLSHTALCLGGLVLLCGLTGCSRDAASLSDGKRNEKGYSTPQIMMIATTEKNRYEALCTDQIWKVQTGNDGESFEEYLTGQIQGFMEEMRVMNLLAKEREVDLTPQELTAMTEAAEEYYGALTGDDIERMELTREEVQELYEDYCVAEKLVTELTGGMDLEVSDSEARMVVVKEVRAEDAQTAEALRTAALAEGADFEACAAEAGLPVTERAFGRKEETPEYEEAAFSLVAGEVSQVLKKDGAWYVLQCVSDYDREATAARKELIYEERRQRAFREIYDGYRQEIKISYSGDPFEELGLSTGGCAEEADFFEIYRKYAD